MIDKEAIPYSIQVKPRRGILGMIFAYGATINPKGMWKRQGLHRIVGCPHCGKNIEAPRYTQKETLLVCCCCGGLIKYRQSF